MKVGFKPDHNLSLRNQSGVTLLEVTFAMAVMILVISVSVMLTQLVKDQQFLSTQSSVVSSLEGTIKAYSRRATEIVGPKWFRPTRSFYRKNLILSKTPRRMIADYDKTADMKVLFKFRGRNLHFYRTSHNMELRRLDTNIETSDFGLLVSRCVDVNERHDKLKPIKILKLPRVPLIFESKGRLTVKCCLKANDRDNPVCPGGDLSDRTTKWRPRVFFINNDTVKVYPKYKERRYVIGAGFMGYFDHPEEPDQFAINAFIVSNNCISAKDTKIGIKKHCDETTRKTLVRSHVETRAVYKDSFHQSGMIRLGK